MNPIARPTVIMAFGLVAVGCTVPQPVSFNSLQRVTTSRPASSLTPLIPIAVGASPPIVAIANPRAPVTPVPAASVTPRREILPFRAGDRFIYDVHFGNPDFKLFSLPAGKLTMDIQSVTRAGATETTDLTLTAPLGSAQPHRIVLKNGMFNYDDQPFIPEVMLPNQTWPAQDGTAEVVGREFMGVPAGDFSACYKVFVNNPAGETMTLWFAPYVGLIGADFSLHAYSRGWIDLTEYPTDLAL